MTSKLRIYGIVLLIGVTTSCGRVPKDILTQQKMRVVLYDMQLAEALIESNPADFGTNNERQDVYNAVFAKHNITQSELDSSMIWYGKNMDLYIRIYDLVIKDINDSFESLGEIKPSPLSVDVSAKDSIDIWMLKQSFTFSPDNIFNTLSFDILPHVPFSSGSSFVLGMSAWGLPEGMPYNPRIHISAVHEDTIISVNSMLNKNGYFEVALKTIATKQIKRVHGYITLNNADAKYHRIYLDNIKMMKYNYGSKALTAPNANVNVDGEFDPSEFNISD